MSRGLTLESLKAEFIREFPKSDYFTQQKIFKYMDMSFCMGYESHNNRFKGKSKRIIRSDGREYESVVIAARENMINRDNLYKIIGTHKKSAGYFWKYA